MTGVLLVSGRAAGRHLVVIVAARAEPGRRRGGGRGGARGGGRRGGTGALAATLFVDEVEEDVAEVHGPLFESVADIVTVMGGGRGGVGRVGGGGGGRHRGGGTVTRTD